MPPKQQKRIAPVFIAYFIGCFIATFISTFVTTLLVSALITTSSLAQTADPQPATPREFSKLEQLYLTNSHPDSGAYSEKNLTVLLLFARHALTTGNQELQAYLAADLVPIFRQEPNKFIAAMQKLPSVTSAVCNRLAAHFGTDTEKQKDFLLMYGDKLRSGLTTEAFEVCLEEFE